MSIGRENMKIVLSQDGTRIYADALGDPSNPPIVFIHGFSFSGTVFDKLFSHTQLLGRYYLVRYDLRGHGRSDKPATPDCYTSRLFADDFVAVCEAFELKHPFIAGWSLGATVLTDIATHLHPSLLRGAVYLCGLMSTTISATLSETRTPEAFQELGKVLSEDASIFKEGLQNFHDLCFHESFPVSFDMRCYWLGMSGLSIPSAGLALARTQETEKLCQLGQGTLMVNNVNKLGYSTSLHRDLRSDYSRPLPLLLIHGRQDKLINAEALVKVIRPHFKDLRVHLLPDCGHVPFVEKSDKVATLISDFVQEICETKKRSEMAPLPGPRL